MVIDNCGDFEDSSMLLPGMKQKIAPTSSVVGCAIVNMLEIRTVEYLLEMGVEPPVFHSANVDGGDEFNRTLFEKYSDPLYVNTRQYIKMLPVGYMKAPLTAFFYFVCSRI